MTPKKMEPLQGEVQMEVWVWTTALVTEYEQDQRRWTSPERNHWSLLVGCTWASSLLDLRW
jgi:hypothetical protein